jgi:glycosyltransferase involved in cell wall biosynthesis
MQKILLLTYYYFPCNATASNRPTSFAQNLTRHGYQVTVVTRHWTGQEKVWADYLAGDERPPEIRNEAGVDIHFLPIKSYVYPSSLLSFPFTIFQNLIGNFNYELRFESFIPYIDKLISQQTFDYILVSTPPLTVVKIGAFFAQQYNIPLLVDVRDFENDILLYKKKQHNWLRQQQHTLLLYHFKKWMKESVAIFTASPPLTAYIKEIGYEAFTLTNGFNEALLSLNEEQAQSHFTITVTGTLYEMANLPVMLDTLKLITQRHPDAKIKFQFIGLLADEKVSEMFRAAIPEDKIVLTQRIPQVEAMKRASASHVLMLAGFDTMTGAYTTKIFEYLGLRRNVLQIPGDKDVVEALIIETQCGKAPHTAEDAYKTVMTWYDEWQSTNSLSYHGRMDRILQYSREKQFEKLLKKITT